MRPLRDVKDVGGDKLIVEQSLAAVEVLWNEWEIHVLILASFGLQVFLFLTAGMRRRSRSGILRALLWLAYMSADTVAIFVLGHLAVHADGDDPRNELMLFWAPFLLVHLGGQDTITAFSMQDNELWKRHLLGLVSQIAVAGYVVSRSSWPDARLRAAMLLMFLSGCIRYAARTYCLYAASPANLRGESLSTFSRNLRRTRQENKMDMPMLLRRRFELVFSANRKQQWIQVQNRRINDVSDIMSVDAPVNVLVNILGVDGLPDCLARFKYSADRCGAYEYVGAELVYCYETLYTKIPLLRFCRCVWYLDFSCEDIDDCVVILSSLVLVFFQYISTPIALVLFIVAQKESQLHTRAGVIVSYILLVGAIILDLSSIFMFVASLLGLVRRKEWSKMLGQYGMIKRYAREDNGSMLSVGQQWISKRLNALRLDLLDPSITYEPVNEDLKKFVLDKLLGFGTGKRQYWHFASTRGQLALGRWKEKDSHSVFAGAITDLEKSINGVDFQTSVVIWHIATDICFDFHGSNRPDSDLMRRSKELSNYIMYLVFKCGVMLTVNSQTVHRNVCDEMKEADTKVFQQKEDEQPTTETETETIEQQLQVGTGRETRTSSSSIPTNQMDLLMSTAQTLSSPVLPRAREVAQKLIAINGDEAARWDLIAGVWMEMLFYIAPRCGAAFHYHHLATGGEFVTHVLLLMRLIGPFLPPPIDLPS